MNTNTSKLFQPVLSGLAISLITCTLSACGGIHMELNTPAAIRAKNDGRAGLIAAAKSTDGRDNAYWTLRRRQNEESGTKSILATLFGPRESKPQQLGMVEVGEGSGS